VDRTPSFLKWLASGLAGIALFTGLFLLKGNGRAVPLPVTVTASPSATIAPSKPELLNLLVTIARDDQRIAGSFLLVANTNVDKIHIFAVNPRAVIDTQGSGLTDLATAGFENPSSQVQQALEYASGVRIDGSLVLQRLALAGLIDSVRGIDIVNPTSLHVSIQENEIATIPAGEVHLDGGHGAAYALTRVTKEPQIARTTRMNLVLQATFAKLPTNQQRMKEVLSSLGSLSRTTVPTADVANYLVRLNHKRVWPSAKSTTLTTVASALGGKTKMFWERFDLNQVVDQVGSFTPAAFTPYSKSNIRVAVSSHNVSDRLAARDDFRNTPFVFVDDGGQIVPKTTRVRVLYRMPALTIVNLRKALGLKKLDVLQLGPAVDDGIQGSGAKQSGHRVADITVTLGDDYRALHDNKESVN